MPKPIYTTSRLGRAALALLATCSIALALPSCGASSTVPPAPATEAPPASTQPVATPPSGLTLPFAKEANTGQQPALVTVENIPLVGFYVNKGGLVLAPHEASVVEVLLVTEPTAVLSEGGIVMNFIHPAGFASQIYLWHGQAVQQDKSGRLNPLSLTKERPSIQYGPVYRGQVVGIAGEAFPQPHFQGVSLLLSLAVEGGRYIPPDAMWLHGKPQYIATPTPQK